jgi:2EXR family
MKLESSIHTSIFQARKFPFNFLLEGIKQIRKVPSSPQLRYGHRMRMEGSEDSPEVGSSLPISTSTATPAFELFSKFPKELRLAVWEEVLKSPRTVTLTQDGPDISYYPDIGTFRVKGDLRAISQVPALLHVNQEAREEALQKYICITLPKRQTPFYFNPKADWLCFDYLDTMLYLFNHAGSATLELLLQNVRQIIIHGEECFQWCGSPTDWALFKQFKELDTLIFGMHDDIPDFVGVVNWDRELGLYIGQYIFSPEDNQILPQDSTGIDLSMLQKIKLVNHQHLSVWKYEMVFAWLYSI